MRFPSAANSVMTSLNGMSTAFIFCVGRQRPNTHGQAANRARRQYEGWVPGTFGSSDRLVVSIAVLANHTRGRALIAHLTLLRLKGLL